MADQRGGGIAWTDESWNPIRGCSRVDEDCVNCYAEGVAARFSGPGLAYEGLARRSGKGLPLWTGEVRMVPEHFADPIRWQRPRRIFVNSMSDLFHEKMTNEQIAAVFGVMAAARRHTFQVLTKRARRMHEWFQWVQSHDEGDAWTNCHFEALRYEAQCNGDMSGAVHERSDDEPGRPWPLPNVHLGVSAGFQRAAEERVPWLLDTPAAVRWVSAEPLLAQIDLTKLALPSGGHLDAYRGTGVRPSPLTGVPIEVSSPGLDWIVLGGESGPRARNLDLDWIRYMVAQAAAAGVPLFLKQLGTRAVDGGAALQLDDGHGGDENEWPEELRGIRHFPRVAA